MRVLSTYTAHKYKGAMARDYEKLRKGQTRWKLENQLVADILTRRHASVEHLLDVPVGTGRYLALYRDLKFKVTGIDSNPDMLMLAQAKQLPGQLLVGNVLDLEFTDRKFDAVVCIRLLDLIEEEAMRQAVKEMCRVARHLVVCTIRLGNSYVLKQRTATHDESKFKALVKRCGWTIVQWHPIFKQGWYVLELEPQGSKGNGGRRIRVLEYAKQARTDTSSPDSATGQT